MWWAAAELSQRTLPRLPSRTDGPLLTVPSSVGAARRLGCDAHHLARGPDLMARTGPRRTVKEVKQTPRPRPQSLRRIARATALVTALTALTLAGGQLLGALDQNLATLASVVTHLGDVVDALRALGI